MRKEYAATGNGQAYSRWQLSDLKSGELRVVLFGDAHSTHKLMVSVGCYGLACACACIDRTPCSHAQRVMRIT